MRVMRHILLKKMRLTYDKVFDGCIRDLDSIPTYIKKLIGVLV